MPQWGAGTTDEKKPQWRWLLTSRGDKIAKVFATEKGWCLRWPWGDEVLVGIGGLNTVLGVANTAMLEILTTGYVVNAASQGISLLVQFNEPVTVNGTPTIDAIASANANVTLSYSEADSDPSAGRLVFTANASLAGANYANANLTVNSTSTVAGWDGIHDAGNDTAVANGVDAGVAAVTLKVYQQKPVHTGTTRVGTATNTANQTVSFALKFNQGVVVTGTPTVSAIGDATANANLVLSYSAASSNVAAGNLVFKSAATSFATLTTNAVFTVNSTSVLTGFDGIKNAIGGVVANTIAVANTFTVTTA